MAKSRKYVQEEKRLGDSVNAGGTTIGAVSHCAKSESTAAQQHRFGWVSCFKQVDYLLPMQD